jgi:membrane fusion protein, heavy metal efflux system
MDILKIIKSAALTAGIFSFAAFGVSCTNNSVHDHEDDHGQNVELHDEHDHDNHDEDHEGHQEENHDDEHDIHKEDNDEQGHENHADHDEAIDLHEDELTELGIKVSPAGPGVISVSISLPGKITLDPDRVAHVVPRICGIASEIKKTVGDHVKKDEVLAVLESRELADGVADYLGAKKRASLTWSVYSSEKELWQKKITSRQEYLEAQSAYSEARINRNSAEQKLMALGLLKKDIKALSGKRDDLYTRYVIKAPFEGEVIYRPATLGELLGDDEAVFIIADLSEVWVDLDVFPQDLSLIKKGQKVTIMAGRGSSGISAEIDYVAPLIGEDTRTAKARVKLANPNGALRPGIFITAQVNTKTEKVKVLVPKDAVQTIAGEKVIFIKDEHGFETVPVKVGRATKTHIEILQGIAIGQSYVSEGAFVLKSKIITSGIDPHAGHGH